MKMATAKPSTRRVRWSAASAILASLAAAISLSACGGAGSVIDPVANAATISNGAPGYRLTLAMRIGSPSLPTGISATGTGSIDRATHSAALTLSMQLPNSAAVTSALGGSNTLQIREIVHGLIFYIGLPPALASKLPGGRPWLKLNLAKAAAAQGLGGLSSLTNNPASSDPSQFLQYLRASSGKITKVGQATVLGFQTTHYRGDVDLSRAANTVPASDRATFRQTISHLEAMTGLTHIPVDVWVDSGHRVRQMVMSFSENVPSSGQKISISIRIGIPQYGPQPAPVVPAADQVTDLSSLTGQTS
jgi:hypothetical protein